jgi:hypothetical protein
MSEQRLRVEDVAVWRSRPEESSVIFCRNGQGLSFGTEKCSSRFVLPIHSENDFMSLMNVVGEIHGLRPFVGKVPGTIVFQKSLLLNTGLQHGDKIRRLAYDKVFLLRNFCMLAGSAKLQLHKREDFHKIVFMLGVLLNKFFIPDHEHPVLTLICKEY